jgi:chitinase
MASFVKTYSLDGIDVDYEDFGAINKGDGSAENWLITFTTQLRANLPAGQYIITHAREFYNIAIYSTEDKPIPLVAVAPWFGHANYPAGAYWKVNQQVGSLIDWYVQYVSFVVL